MSTHAENLPDSQFSYEQKLRLAADLYWNARALKEAYFRMQHPELPEEEIREMVKQWMMYART